MKYTSTNGCLFYYDRITYEWKVAEPTMLFLLGFESATAFNNSQSDTITIIKQLRNSDDLLELTDYNIYDEIYSYLSAFGSIENFDEYFIYNCNGLKLLLNELTGTDENRTIPIIYKNDTNKSSIDLSVKPYRLNINDPSILDIQAQKIYDIYDDAGYNDKLNVKLIKPDTTQYEKEYNEYITAIHNERELNSNLFRLIDYKAMYSYSLGVLYACHCLGYLDELIWRFDPSFWYKGRLNNLINTAWRTFKFTYNTVKYSESTSSEDDLNLYKKYQEIQKNKIWNFSDITLNKQLEKDEQLCYCITYDKSDKTNNSVKTILYSKSVHTDINDKGSYISIVNSEELLSGDWTSVDTLIDDNTGIIELKNPITRYIANNSINFYKAYKYDDENYLSPDNNHTYYSNLTGWISFNEKACTQFSSDNNPLLTLSQKSFKSLPKKDLNNDSTIGLAQKINEDGEPDRLVSYYKSKIDTQENNDLHIYGIFDGIVDTTDETNNVFPTNTLFIDVVSEAEFAEKYNTESITIDQNVYSLRTYYNLTDTINLYINKLYNDTSDITFFVGTTSEQSIGKFGYSSTPSIEKDTYTLLNNELNKFNLRYNSVYNKYWSDEFTNKQWTGLSELSELNLYTKLNKVNLYKNVNILLEDIDSYTSLQNEENIINENLFVIENILQEESHFTSLQTLYNNGITPYLCDIVYEDDYGNSLLDEDGNPLVWYDFINDKYWNGIGGANEWINTKPQLAFTKMYDTTTNKYTDVIDNLEARTVTINNITISYEEFYDFMNHDYTIVETPEELSLDDTSRLVVKLKLQNIVISDDNEHTYSFFTADNNEVNFNGDVLATIGSDDDESFIFLSVPSSSNTFETFLNIKYVDLIA